MFDDGVWSGNIGSRVFAGLQSNECLEWVERRRRFRVRQVREGTVFSESKTFLQIIVFLYIITLRGLSFLLPIRKAYFNGDL